MPSFLPPTYNIRLLSLKWPFINFLKGLANRFAKVAQSGVGTPQGSVAHAYRTPPPSPSKALWCYGAAVP